MDRFVAHDASGLVILRSWDPGITEPWIAPKMDYDHDPASSLISLPATYQRRDLRPWISKITSSVSSFRSITTSIGLCLQFKAASFHVRPSLQTWLVRKILANPRPRITSKVRRVWGHPRLASLISLCVTYNAAF